MIKTYLEDGWEVKFVADEESINDKGMVDFGLAVRPLPAGMPYGNTGKISVEVFNQIKEDEDYLKVMLGTLKSSYPKGGEVKRIKESIKERLKKM